MLPRIVARNVGPALRAPRVCARSLSVSAVRLQEGTESKLPRGTVVPGSKVDSQLGDYPAMPMENQQFRPYSRQWWDTQDRRNYGETVGARSACIADHAAP